MRGFFVFIFIIFTKPKLSAIKVNEALLQYGLPGIVILGLVSWILIMRKDHKKELDKRDAMLEKLSDKQDKREEKTQDLMRDNIGILQGLKALLEVQHRK